METSAAELDRRTSTRGAAGTRQLDVLEILFVLTAFLAPLNVQVFRALTLYDLTTAILAILLLAGPRHVSWLPASLRLAGLLLVLAGLISAFRSTYPLEAIFQVGQYAFVLFVQLPVVLSLARRRDIIHAAVGMILLGYLVVIVLAMVLGRAQLAGRVVPFFNDSPNALATPTVFLVPFVCYFALQQWRRGRWISVVAGGGAVTYLFMWALTASASRGATAAVIVSLVLFWALGHDARPTLHGVLRVAVIVAVVGGLVAIAYTTSAFPDKLKDRIERTFDPEEDRELTEGRVALNRAGMQAFLESPFVGTGSNNFRYVAQFYDDEATFHEPHNLWIQFLAQTGLVGAGAFAFIIVRWFVLVVRARSVAEERSDRELLAAFIAAWVGIMAQSCVAPLVLHRHYWLLYGLGIAAAVVIGRDVRATRTVEGSEFLLHQP